MTKVDLKVVLLGQQNVGKSCLVDRFLNSKFDDTQKNTIGAAFGAKRVYLPNGKGMTLGIWDTAGAERFESLSRVYYHTAGVALICFDPSKIDTWDKLEFWVNELRESEPNCKIYLIETKHDKVHDGEGRVVSEFDVQSYAKEIDAKVVQTSAKTGYNVTELFLGVARDAYAVSNESNQDTTTTIHLESRPSKSKKPPSPCCP